MRLFNSYLFKIFLMFFLSFTFLEAFFRVLEFKNIFGVEIIRILLFNLTLSLLLTFIISFFKHGGKFLSLSFIFIFAFYGLFQINYKNFMGNYMSFGAAGDGAGRIGEQVKTFIFSVEPLYLIVFIPFLICLFLVLKYKHHFAFRRTKIKDKLILLFLISIVHFASLYTLDSEFFESKNQIKSNKELYSNPSLMDISLKQFGYIRFLYLDVINLVSTNEAVIIEVPIEEPKETDFSRKIDDTAWKSLIASETNKNILDVHNFFINQNITPKNEMTGLFKDKNLIYIMVEAFDMMAINKELTPTLYKLSTEGFYFDNYYAPKYSCTTGESEYIGLTSIIPSLSVCTPNSYKNNNHETSVFSIFNKSGYHSTSYHNYSDKFYERTTLHENMGSIKFYNNDDLAIKQIKGWPSDVNLMQEALPHFINEDKFLSFIITSSMHFPYDEDGHAGVVIKNWEKVKDLSYNIKVKRYLAKAIEFDLAIEYLLEQLEEKGKLDDTAIVLFSDHHPLNLERSYINEASSINRFEDFNMDRLPFIIYNSEVEGKVISDVASTFDILPTILNLFDLDYDPRYYVGKDLFSEEENIVIFPSGSWITDKAMYFSSRGEFKYTGVVDDDYVININNRVNNYFTISDLVLRKDYFKYRFGE